ncbi:MAG: hypothetical protein Kow0029_13180 [Candidatus Rifleibacteriota bacterium]
MFVSKFLLNRQKIFNAYDIHKAIESYFPAKNIIPGEDYQYRLEWYKIGIVVPVIVYSRIKPEMKLMKEFQLIESEEKPLAPFQNGDIARFSIFVVPENFENLDVERDFEKVRSWLKTYLKKAAIVSECFHGPDNCIYYDKDGIALSQQTITLKGSLQVKDPDKLEMICQTALGKFPELGCGLLYLY